MEVRLQKRYLLLTRQHMAVVPKLAAGIRSLPGVGKSFAAAQAAWRFFANLKVTMPALVEPLRTLGRQASAESSSSYALLVHDWSKLDYSGHKTKTDQTQLSNALDVGYELTTALLVDAGTGHPLAPMEISLRTAKGCHTTTDAKPLPALPHLDQVLPVMQASRNWHLPRRLVHVIDREADSVEHLRQWYADGHLFLVRGDDRRVRYQGKSRLLSEIVQTLRRQEAFQEGSDAEVRGKKGRLFVAETEVVLSGPAWQRDSDGKKYRVPGPALTLRFVVVQVRNARGRVLAEWLLLTNVPADVSAMTIGLWYYWRWRIETFHKLVKSAGMQLESWQQETGLAIAKRLLVACMACVVAWQLERLDTPQAKTWKQFLMDLSGRQTKRSRPVTTPGLLEGLRMLFVTLDILDQYTPNELRKLAAAAIPMLRLSG